MWSHDAVVLCPQCGAAVVCSLQTSFCDVLVPTPLPLPLQVLNTISGCTLDQGISIYELIKKVGQHGFGEKNIK